MAKTSKNSKRHSSGVQHSDNPNTANEPTPQYGQSQPLSFEQVWLMFKETDKKFQETDKQLRETDKKIKELSNLFTSQWGKLVESLVEGDLVNVLNKRGVRVERTIQRVKGNHNGENGFIERKAAEKVVFIIW